MGMKMCDVCHKLPATVFITKVENGIPTPQALCIKCAMNLNIPNIDRILKNSGIDKDMIDKMIEDFGDRLSEENFKSFLKGQLGLDDDADDDEIELEIEDDDDDDDNRVGRRQSMDFLSGLRNIFGTPDKKDQKGSEEDMRDDDEIADLIEQNGGNSSKYDHRSNKKSKKKKKVHKYLDRYCLNLNEKARAGKMDTIIGRDKEISRVIRILCRRSKNNPCLVGEPGVGKTAIAEGIARRIVSKNVPARLEEKEIFLLDMTALVAGTQFRGRFESRMKNLIREVKADGNVILFIDEIHSLVGAGGSEDSMSAANILKPALSRGEVRVIGATTFKEYRKYIEKDAALERRFRRVKVEEPSISDTVEMLVGVKKYYEMYHKVRISNELVSKAVDYSERYITDRFLPDKAIDLLDEACTCANLRNKAIGRLEKAKRMVDDIESELEDVQSAETVNYELLAKLKTDLAKYNESIPVLEEQAKDNAVTDRDIAKVIELWTGIPAVKIIQSDAKKLLTLESDLEKKIIGQKAACHAVANAIKRSRMNVSAVRRPASFIFVGPTGVGKTELVKVLSKQLFDSPETLVRLDMNEFMEKHSVSRIIGSPPGYVGYDEAGQLTEKIRRKPYSVVLFDEIEKAHPDVMNVLLQILDEGRITDAQGRAVSFENTVIVMTSNAGSRFKKGAIGFGTSREATNKDRAMKGLREFLRPEFLGRVDEVIVFNELSKENFVEIAKLNLEELSKHIADKAITLTFDESVARYIASNAKVARSGARELRTVIRDEIEDAIADLLIENSETGLSLINVTVEDGKLKFFAL